METWPAPEVRSVNETVRAAPGATSPRFHVTAPCAMVPPPSAETNVTPEGTAARKVVFLHAASPLLVMVNFTVALRPMSSAGGHSALASSAGLVALSETAWLSALRLPSAVAIALFEKLPVLFTLTGKVKERVCPPASVPASNSATLRPSDVVMPSGSGSRTRTLRAAPVPLLVTSILTVAVSHTVMSAGVMVLAMRSAGCTTLIVWQSALLYASSQQCEIVPALAALPVTRTVRLCRPGRLPSSHDSTLLAACLACGSAETNLKLLDGWSVSSTLYRAMSVRLITMMSYVKFWPTATSPGLVRSIITALVARSPVGRYITLEPIRGAGAGAARGAGCGAGDCALGAGAGAGVVFLAWSSVGYPYQRSSPVRSIEGLFVLSHPRPIAPAASSMPRHAAAVSLLFNIFHLLRKWEPPEPSHGQSGRPMIRLRTSPDSPGAAPPTAGSS